MFGEKDLRVLLASMAPSLDAENFVFCTADDLQIVFETRYFA